MAQALRTVLLEPEEPQENIAITLTPRHERKAAPDLLQRPGRLMLCLAGGLALLMLYIGGNAQIARYEYERQALQQEYAQLSRDCVRLTMSRDRMASQPKVTAVAQSIGLEVPPPTGFTTSRWRARSPRKWWRRRRPGSPGLPRPARAWSLRWTVPCSG